MGQSLADASRIAAASFESAARPILSKFNGMTLQAAVAETKLKGAVTWFTWKWAGLVSASIMCMFIVWCLLAQALLWWHKDEVDQLLVQRAALTRELAQLQAQADVFEARAGRAILTRCGIENRLCVRIDKQAGVFGDERLHGPAGVLIMANHRRSTKSHRQMTKHHRSLTKSFCWWFGYSYQQLTKGKNMEHIQSVILQSGEIHENSRTEVRDDMLRLAGEAITTVLAGQKYSLPDDCILEGELDDEDCIVLRLSSPSRR